MVPEGEYQKLLHEGEEIKVLVRKSIECKPAGREDNTNGTLRQRWQRRFIRAGNSVSKWSATVLNGKTKTGTPPTVPSLGDSTAIDSTKDNLNPLGPIRKITTFTVTSEQRDSISVHPRNSSELKLDPTFISFTTTCEWAPDAA
jgi:hypothetical protein